MSEFYKELRVDNGLRKIGVNDKAIIWKFPSMTARFLIGLQI